MSHLWFNVRNICIYRAYDHSAVHAIPEEEFRQRLISDTILKKKTSGAGGKITAAFLYTDIASMSREMTFKRREKQKVPR